MRAWCALIAALLSSAPLVAQNSLNGTWSGAYNRSVMLSSCSNQTYTTSGNVTVTFLQTGNDLVGRADLTNALIFGNSCTPTKGEVTHVLIGSVSSSSFSWHYPNDSNGTLFAATTDGSSITAQISDAFGGTGTATLTRTASDAPAVNLTGGWSGNYSLSDLCPSGSGKISYNGQFTLALTQIGSYAAGVATMTNVPLYDQNCATVAPLNMSMVAAGVVSGSTFTGSVFDPSGSFDFPMSATISNGAMNVTVSGVSPTTTTGSFTLTQSGAQLPASDFAGSYDGSYNETDNEIGVCANLASLPYNGDASISIVQSGTAVAGVLIFQDVMSVSVVDAFGDCAAVNVGETVLPLYGTLSGSTLTLNLPLGGGATATFTFTFGGQTIDGTISDSFGDAATFTTSLTAGTTPPPAPGPRRRVVRP